MGNSKESTFCGDYFSSPQMYYLLNKYADMCGVLICSMFSAVLCWKKFTLNVVFVFKKEITLFDFAGTLLSLFYRTLVSILVESHECLTSLRLWMFYTKSILRGTTKTQRYIILIY